METAGEPEQLPGPVAHIWSSNRHIQAGVSLISTFGIRVKNYFEVDNRGRDPAHNTFIFPS